MIRTIASRMSAGAAEAIEPAAPPTKAERDNAHLLELLQTRDARPVTISELQLRGIEQPAQVVYELQLAGHVIDQVHVAAEDGNEHRTLGYRLRPSRARRAVPSTP